MCPSAHAVIVTPGQSITDDSSQRAGASAGALYLLIVARPTQPTEIAPLKEQT
jgi:hypothetical protein